MFVFVVVHVTGIASKDAVLVHADVARMRTTRLKALFTISVHDNIIAVAKVLFMACRDEKPAVRRDENVLSFVRPPEKAFGADTLDLIYRAAEVFSDMERETREVESRALAICENAAERLKLAEQRTEAAEQSLREVIAAADRRLADASKALAEIDLRVAAAEDKTAAAEARAHSAETEAREAKHTLALVEEAIRKHLLCASPDVSRNIRDVA